MSSLAPPAVASPDLGRDTRGVAMVEAAVLAPIFVLLFVSVVYLFRSFDAKLDTGDVARTCAWRYAATSCTDLTSLPPACKIDEDVDPAQLGFGGLLDAADATTTRAGQDLAAASDDDTLGQLLDGVGALSDVALTAMGMSNEFYATAEKTVKRPAMLGGRTFTARTRYAVMCNEKSRDFLEFIGDAWDTIVK